MKKTAIIITNYSSTIEVLKYIEKVKNYPIINKIMIVDNNSSKENLKMLEQLKYEKVTLIKSNENLGYAKGNNLGIKSLKEKFDYIIVSNPDILVEEETIRNCIKILESNEKIGIVAPRLWVNGKPDKMSAWKERTFGSDIINSLRLLQILLYPIYIKKQYREKDFKNDILEVDCISGAFFIIRYDILEKVNFFDSNTFLFYEEDILCKKIRNLGYKILSINTEKCIHYKSKSIDKTFSAFAKKDIFNKSRKYYHSKYNNISKWKLKIFDILNCLKKIEILMQKIYYKLLNKKHFNNRRKI